MRSDATISTWSSPTANSSRTLPECRCRWESPDNDPSVNGRVIAVSSCQRRHPLEDTAEPLQVALRTADLVEAFLVEWLPGIGGVLAQRLAEGSAAVPRLHRGRLGDAVRVLTRQP